MSRRRNATNGVGDKASVANGSGRTLGAAMMEQQRSSMAGRSRVINGRFSGHASLANGLATQPRGVNGTPTPQEKPSSSRGGGGKYASDLVVVLDMDECLIHSQFLSDRLVDKYRQVEDRPSTSAKGNNEEAFLWSTFRIKLPDGDLVNVNKRPNLDLFLKEITSKFETYIFTAAMEVSATEALVLKCKIHFCTCVINPSFIVHLNHSRSQSPSNTIAGLRVAGTEPDRSQRHHVRRTFLQGALRLRRGHGSVRQEPLRRAAHAQDEDQRQPRGRRGSGERFGGRRCVPVRRTTRGVGECRPFIASIFDIMRIM